jgi:hypothetical protein
VARKRTRSAKRYLSAEHKSKFVALSLVMVPPARQHGKIVSADLNKQKQKTALITLVKNILYRFCFIPLKEYRRIY